jgi:hypothetical protein
MDKTKFRGTGLGEILALPLGHLRIDPRLLRFTQRFEKIGDLLAAVQRSEDFVPTGAKVARRRLRSLLADLAPVIEEPSNRAWERFRERRCNRSVEGDIYFYAPSLRNLSAATKKGKLATLHLGHRAIAALGAVGIQTVGQLVEEARSGIRNLPYAGRSTTNQIITSLSALSASVQSGEIDWVSYAKMRGFLIIPSRHRSQWSPKGFIRKLPSVAERAVRVRYGKNGVLVLRGRLLRMEDKRRLRQIGGHLGVTRERIRKIEALVIEMFRRIFLADEYPGCAFRLRPEFVEPLRTLEARLRQFRIGTFTSRDWKVCLQRFWSLSPRHLSAAERLILEVLNHPIGGRRRERSLAVPSTRQIQEVDDAVASQVKWLLQVRYPHGLTEVQLRKILKRKFGLCAPTRAELHDLVESSRALESHCGRARARLASLRRRDQVERLLREAKRPMHLRELPMQTFAPNAITDPRLLNNLSSNLKGDRRFVALGQSGFWALADWAFVDARYIVDVAAAILRRSGNPLHQDQLFTLISRRRALKASSIPALLRRDGRFERVAPRTWRLVRGKRRQ